MHANSVLYLQRKEQKIRMMHTNFVKIEGAKGSGFDFQLQNSSQFIWHWLIPSMGSKMQMTSIRNPRHQTYHHKTTL